MYPCPTHNYKARYPHHNFISVAVIFTDSFCLNFSDCFLCFRWQSRWYVQTHIVWIQPCPLFQMAITVICTNSYCLNLTVSSLSDGNHCNMYKLILFEFNRFLCFRWQSRWGAAGLPQLRGQTEWGTACPICLDSWRRELVWEACKVQTYSFCPTICHQGCHDFVSLHSFGSIDWKRWCSSYMT
jgi:hypothetical protein